MIAADRGHMRKDVYSSAYNGPRTQMRAVIDSVLSGMRDYLNNSLLNAPTFLSGIVNAGLRSE